jgi:dienelactone hydrolase
MSSDESSSVVTRQLDYGDGDVRLHGVLHTSATQRGPAPGILVVHGGAGLDDHALDQAGRYAKLGYVVFACDMFGEGVTGDREKIMACLHAFRDDPALLARRAAAGAAKLSGRPEVNGKIAAVGFCFGGMAALTLARSGADLAGAVSIHGSLATTAKAGPGAVRARLLVCHGAADPHVPMADVVAFGEEMERAGADWQLVIYGNAVHGFTHEHAVPGAAPGVAYDEAADRRSFAATRAFLAEAFGR